MVVKEAELVVPEPPEMKTPVAPGPVGGVAVEGPPATVTVWLPVEVTVGRCARRITAEDDQFAVVGGGVVGLDRGSDGERAVGAGAIGAVGRGTRDADAIDPGLNEDAVGIVGRIDEVVVGGNGDRAVEGRDHRAFGRGGDAGAVDHDVVGGGESKSCRCRC